MVLSYPIAWWMLFRATVAEGESSWPQLVIATIVLAFFHLAVWRDRKMNGPTEVQLKLLEWDDLLKACKTLPWWASVKHVWLYHQHELTNEQKLQLHNVLHIELYYRFDEPAQETMNVWNEINEQLFTGRATQQSDIDEALTLIEADQSWERMKRTVNRNNHSSENRSNRVQ